MAGTLAVIVEALGALATGVLSSPSLPSLPSLRFADVVPTDAVIADAATADAAGVFFSRCRRIELIAASRAALASAAARTALAALAAAAFLVFAAASALASEGFAGQVTSMK